MKDEKKTDKYKFDKCGHQEACRRMWAKLRNGEETYGRPAELSNIEKGRLERQWKLKRGDRRRSAAEAARRSE